MREHTPDTLESARRLRKSMSLPEVLLWQRLKGKPMGVKFRKQHPLGRYVLDFFCAEKRIGIEVDGVAHDMGDRPLRDLQRTAAIEAMGVSLFRLSASDVLADADAAAERIVRHCASAPPPSALRAATSPGGGGFSGALY